MNGRANTPKLDSVWQRPDAASAWRDDNWTESHTIDKCSGLLCFLSALPLWSAGPAAWEGLGSLVSLGGSLGGLATWDLVRSI
jgi:hypothetical protein